MQDKAEKPAESDDRQVSDAAEPGHRDNAGDTSSAERFDPAKRPKEYGGRKGPDPVRYGDWEKNGRCIDF